MQIIEYSKFQKMTPAEAHRLNLLKLRLERTQQKDGKTVKTDQPISH